MRAIKKVEGASVVACVSSSKERAEAYKQKYKLEAAYTYDELLTAKDIDAVYVCTNMNVHSKNAIAFLNAGFPVLCEKALATTVQEAEAMFAAARAANVPLMEAMWTRFLPCTEKLLEVVNSKKLGEIRKMSGVMNNIFPKNHRVFDVNRGGGTMLDMMVYNVSYAHFLKGVPQKVEARGEVRNGVDVTCDLDLTYPDGAVACLESSSVPKAFKFRFEIRLEKGKIVIPHFHWGTGFKVYGNGKRAATEKYRFKFPNFTYEIKHFNNLLKTKQTESPLRSPQDTLEVMSILEEANNQLGVTFP
jgi:predicted dehydrogenase